MDIFVFPHQEISLQTRSFRLEIE